MTAGLSWTTSRKSVIPGWCKDCFQHNVARNRQLAQDRDRSDATSPAEASQHQPAMPPRGWKRTLREGEQLWYARIQGHLDEAAGGQKRPRCEYLSCWTQELSTAQKQAFRNKVARFADPSLEQSGPLETTMEPAVAAQMPAVTEEAEAEAEAGRLLEAAEMPELETQSDSAVSIPEAGFSQMGLRGFLGCLWFFSCFPVGIQQEEVGC